MSRTIPRPDHKVELADQILRDPVEGCVDERYGAVAVAGFGAVYTGSARFAVACNALRGACMGPVEFVGVEVLKDSNRDQLV